MKQYRGGSNQPKAVKNTSALKTVFKAWPWKLVIIPGVIYVATLLALIAMTKIWNLPAPLDEPPADSTQITMFMHSISWPLFLLAAALQFIILPLCSIISAGVAIYRSHKYLSQTKDSQRVADHAKN